MPPPGPIHSRLTSVLGQSMNNALVEQMDKRLGGFRLDYTYDLTKRAQKSGRVVLKKVPDIVLLAPRGCIPTELVLWEISVSQLLEDCLDVMEDYKSKTDAEGGIVLNVEEHPIYEKPEDEAPEHAMHNPVRNALGQYVAEGHIFAGTFSATIHVQRRGEPDIVAVE